MLSHGLIGVLSHGLVGVLSHGLVGVLSEAHRGKRKNNKRGMQSKHCVHSHLSGWFRAHKKSARCAEMMHAKKVQDQQP